MRRMVETQVLIGNNNFLETFFGTCHEFETFHKFEPI